MDLAILLARRAFTPRPGALPLVALPRGAWGTTMCAACEGLCSGWTCRGEASGVEVADMALLDVKLAERVDRKAGF